MIYRRFGRTELKISRLALGSGGPNQFGQKAGVPEQDIHRLVHGALDLGINFFDTSPGYGESELILGRALKGIPRDRYLVSTKFGLAPAGRWDDIIAPNEVIATVENSLRRLQISEIDLLLVQHWPRWGVYRRIIEELWPTLTKLQEQGKIRYLGASEISRHDGSHQWLTRGLRDNLFDGVMVAYNMINQSAEREVFPLCQANDVGTQTIFVVRKVFNRPERLNQVVAELKRKEIVPPDSLPDDDPLGWLVKGGVSSLVSAAYKFCAGHEAVSTVMTGTINLAHLAENVEAISGDPLPSEDLERLRQVFGAVAEPIGN